MKQNSRSQVARLLTQGKAGGKDSPTVNAVDDQLAISMALDMAYDGHISRANARTIKGGRGINVAGLSGAKSYADRKRSRGTISRPRVVGRPTSPRRTRALRHARDHPDSVYPSDR